MYNSRLSANHLQDPFGLKLMESLFNRHQLNQQREQLLPNLEVNLYLMDLRSLRTESILFSSRWHLRRITKITHVFILVSWPFMDSMGTAKKLGRWTVSTGSVISYRQIFQTHVFIVGAMMPIPTELLRSVFSTFTITQKPWSQIYAWKEGWQRYWWYFSKKRSHFAKEWTRLKHAPLFLLLTAWEG